MSPGNVAAKSTLKHPVLHTGKSGFTWSAGISLFSAFLSWAEQAHVLLSSLKQVQ